MKKVVYVNPKESFELSYPNWLDDTMKPLTKYLVIKSIKDPRTQSFKKTFADQLFIKGVKE